VLTILRWTGCFDFTDKMALGIISVERYITTCYVSC